MIPRTVAMIVSLCILFIILVVMPAIDRVLANRSRVIDQNRKLIGYCYDYSEFLERYVDLMQTYPEKQEKHLKELEDINVTIATVDQAFYSLRLTYRDCGTIGTLYRNYIAIKNDIESVRQSLIKFHNQLDALEESFREEDDK